MSSKSKLRTYITFKTDMTEEPHVTSFLPKPHRSLIQRLCIRTLDIGLETGRHHGKKLEERVCRVCNINKIEDEYHLVFECNG